MVCCRKAREAVRFLRENKVCSQRRATGQCSHPGCQLAIDYATVVEELIAEKEAKAAPPLRVAA